MIPPLRATFAAASVQWRATQSKRVEHRGTLGANFVKESLWSLHTQTPRLPEVPPYSTDARVSKQTANDEP